MKTYIALFRGINVGGKNLLPMNDLSLLFENNGCLDVKTYIQSGNVVFKAKNVSRLNIASQVENEFSFRPEIVLLSVEDFITAVENCPYGSVEGKSCHLFFCSDQPSLDQEKVDSLKTDSENYFLKDRVFYLHAPDGIGRSKLVANVERCLGVSATGRNLNTVNRLLGMAKTDCP